MAPLRRKQPYKSARAEELGFSGGLVSLGPTLRWRALTVRGMRQTVRRTLRENRDDAELAATLGLLATLGEPVFEEDGTTLEFFGVELTRNRRLRANGEDIYGVIRASLSQRASFRAAKVA